MTSSKKKVLWLSHLIPFPPKGGVLQRSYNMIRELSKYHEVFLICFVQPKLLETCFESTEKGMEESKIALLEFCKLGSYRLALKGLFSNLGYTCNWLLTNEALSQIENYSTQYDIDFVHYDTISLAPYKQVLKNLPDALDHHNIESHMMLRRSENSPNLLIKLYCYLEGKKLEKYEKTMCPTFNLNITCSTLDTDRLQKIVQCERIETIPNGVDLSKKTASIERIIDKSNLNFIFIGRLSAYTNAKAADDLVRNIWPLLRSEFPCSKLTIIGSGPSAFLIAQSATDKRLEVTGFVDDISPYLQEAHIYLCPITDGGGTKLKALDALAEKIPLIAHPIACEGIDTIDNVSVVYAKTPEDYVKSTLKLMDQNFYTEIANNGRSLIETQYSYSILGKEFASLIDETLNITRELRAEN
jgi:glycosyltransferase involved in cell wall biosynthesis